MSKSGGRGELSEAIYSRGGEELRLRLSGEDSASGRCLEVERVADSVQFTIMCIKTVEHGDEMMTAGKSRMCRRLVFENRCAGTPLVSEGQGW